MRTPTASQAARHRNPKAFAFFLYRETIPSDFTSSSISHKICFLSVAQASSCKMKFTATLVALFAGSAAAFAPSQMKKSSSALSFTPEDLPGALPPMGFWDPLDFASKADENTLRRYREAEVQHGRVGMLAVVGFLVGEKVEGTSFLWDASIKGPAITHLAQVPSEFWALLTIAIAAAETKRAEVGWVEPENVPFDQPGLLRDEYYPGDIGFDPLGLKPEDDAEFNEMVTKELQHGRLAMLAAAGCIAQELTDGKGIVEHLMG